ncbi:TPA: hypothetical protein ACPY17_004825 [Citrobacter freundii]
MKVKILSVHNHGDEKEEYVMLKVLEDCDIGDYMIADSTYTGDGRISNKIRHTYWFPDKKVAKGDLVSLWTKKGTNLERKTDSGTLVHRFYWGLNQPVWNDDGDCAVLYLISDWSHFRAKPAE